MTLNAALAYSEAGWEIFPLRGKVPAIPSAHPQGDPLRGVCKGECDRSGHGVLDATSDIATVTMWWNLYRGANIGARVHPDVIVVDTDPRHGGEDDLLDMAGPHGGMPETLTCYSGRGDGGRHRYLLHPGGRINSKRLPAGVDLKTHFGYVVLPPSLHPDSGMPYRWAEPFAPVAACPAWLTGLLRPADPVPVRTLNPLRVVRDGDSIADWFTDTTTWDQIREGWTPVAGGWRHPTATSPISATVRHDLLFVYSSNTPFEPTLPDDPHGYTRFRAWAVLQHGGVLSAAARAARALRDRQRVSA